MLTSADICAVIVSYNPDELSFKCIETILNSAAHTVIVDNRSDEFAVRKLRQFASARVSLLENPDNLGVAAALNQGIRTAVGLGYRWFLFFDQDTEIFATSIVDLVRVLNDCLAELGPKLGPLGSNFHLRHGNGAIDDARLPYSPEHKRWVPRELVINAGMALSFESFTAIGPFREDLFVGHVDSEYCLRAQQKGFVVAQMVSPIAVHRLGMLSRKRAFWAMGARKWVWCYSPLRHYYQVRNLLLLARQYEGSFPKCIGDLRRGLRRDTWRTLKYEGRFFQNLSSTVIAWSHGKRGIAGKYAGRLLS